MDLRKCYRPAGEWRPGSDHQIKVLALLDKVEVFTGGRCPIGLCRLYDTAAAVWGQYHKEWAKKETDYLWTKKALQGHMEQIRQKAEEIFKGRILGDKKCREF